MGCINSKKADAKNAAGESPETGAAAETKKPVKTNKVTADVKPDEVTEPAQARNSQGSVDVLAAVKEAEKAKEEELTCAQLEELIEDEKVQEKLAEIAAQGTGEYRKTSLKSEEGLDFGEGAGLPEIQAPNDESAAAKESVFAAPPMPENYSPPDAQLAGGAGSD